MPDARHFTDLAVRLSCAKRKADHGAFLNIMKNRDTTPFYDPTKAYQANVQEGPFGLFAEKTVFDTDHVPAYEVLGQRVNFPFGIPAGPLPTSKFVEAALDKGFDVVTYKTVRSRAWPCNDFPNIIPIRVSGDLTLDMAERGVVSGEKYQGPLTITNSFGVPSSSPDFWQADMAKAVQHARQGQIVIGSLQGTTNEEGDTQAYVHDFATTAKLVKATGVRVFEVNLSCPNEGSSTLLCFDILRARAVVEAVKSEIGNAPLVVKIAYFTSHDQLTTLVEQIGGIIQGIAAINAIPAKIYQDDGHTQQALPGENRLVSGTCGDGIRWAGLDMVGRLKSLREKLGLSYDILGVGGVTETKHYHKYRKAGADIVMSATGAIWNPSLAQQIKRRASIKLKRLSDGL